MEWIQPQKGMINASTWVNFENILTCEKTSQNPHRE
jgi:hypothetical protein